MTRNTFLSTDGLKLCDFGISRVINKACEVREIVGTPDYVGESLVIVSNIFPPL